MSVKTGVKVTETAPMEKKIRGLAKITKAAMQSVIVQWHHGSIKPGLRGHFVSVQEARSKFGANPRNSGLFKPRAVDYSKIKGVRRGHARILEYTGATKRTATMGIRVTGTSKRARGIMAGTKALNFKGHGSHELRREMTAVNAQEEKAMAAIIAARIEKFMEQPETKVTKL